MEASCKRIAVGMGLVGSLEGNQQVIAELKKANGDLAKPTEVNYYLYFHDGSAADSAAAYFTCGLTRGRS